MQNGREWRVYTHVAGTHALQVAHAMDDRREIAAQTALRTLLPFAVMIPMLGVLMWYAVGVGLRPLETMSRAVAKRRPDAMAPLAEDRLPDELQPLAASLNALLARLAEALAAQRRFTADAAHELRTPLAALKLQVELAERSPDGPGARGRLRGAQGRRGPGDAPGRAAPHHGAARARRRRRAPSRRSTWPPSPARRSWRGRRWRRTRTSTWASPAARTCRCAAIAGSLAMLVANLLDNALRYTPCRRAHRRRVDDDGGEAVLSVVDTGPGIPPAEREQVFARFHRGAAADATPGGRLGSGLGLSIVRRIADAHGASVRLEDGPQGRGLAVRVRFPASRRPEAVSHKLAACPPRPCGRDRRGAAAACPALE